MKPINFSAPFLSTSLSLKRWIYISSISILLFAFLLCLVSFYHYKKASALKQMWNSLEHEITEQQQTLKYLASSTKQPRGLSTLYKKFLTKDSLPHTILLSLAHAIAEDTWLEKYTIRKRIGSIQGYTKSPSSLTSFIVKLLANGHFKKVALDLLEQRSQNHFVFKLTICISN